MKWICSQIGAREHYAIPRVLHREGKLDSLYTDLWAGTIWQAMGSFLGRPILASRYHKELEAAEVKSFDFSTLLDKTLGGGSSVNPYDWFLSVGWDFGRSVEASLKRQKGRIWAETIFFGYDTGFLEPASWARQQGAKTVVCQMDPSRFEVELVKEEEQRWPGWSKRPLKVPESYFERRESEWALADLVMVNSEWTKMALMKQGVNVDKLVVVPLAYELPKNQSHLLHCSNIPTFRPYTKQNPLRILFLGQVILRKGIQYLIEAARLLKKEAVRFDVAGPIGISDEAVNSAPENVTFHGAIRRDQAPVFFSNADLFILPTLSDGFAITQIEAMAYGLPVIATSNCGAVVSDGGDGFVIKSSDAESLVSALLLLISSPERLWEMGVAAREKAALFSLSALSGNLANMENDLKELTSR